jgi:hypothetical protein
VNDYGYALAALEAGVIVSHEGHFVKRYIPFLPKHDELRKVQEDTPIAAIAAAAKSLGLQPVAVVSVDDAIGILRDELPVEVRITHMPSIIARLAKEAQHDQR